MLILTYRHIKWERFEALDEGVLMVPLDLRYSQVGFHLNSVQVWGPPPHKVCFWNESSQNLTAKNPPQSPETHKSKLTSRCDTERTFYSEFRSERLLPALVSLSFLFFGTGLENSTRPCLRWQCATPCTRHVKDWHIVKEGLEKGAKTNLSLWIGSLAEVSGNTGTVLEPRIQECLVWDSVPDSLRDLPNPRFGFENY